MITTTHPDVDAARSWWKRCRDVAAGRDALLAGGTAYLPKPEGQTLLDYRNYLHRASFLPVFGRTIAALAGAILRTPPKTAGPEWLIDQLADCTLNDESLTTFARMAVHEVLTVGRIGVLVDLPAEPGGRPYWVAFRAEDIINWRVSRRGTDPAVLVQLVLREISTGPTAVNPFAHEVAVRYRELALSDEGTYQIRTWTRVPADHLVDRGAERWQGDEWVSPTRRGVPLDFLPFTFIGPTGITPAVARPPLLDLVDVSLSHYRNAADREHALYYTACPTPWVSGASGDAPLRIGSATAWRLPENGRAGLLEFTGQGVGAIERAMKQKEMQMASLGAKLLEQPHTNDTATAVMVRHGGDMASLRTIASSLGAAVTVLARTHEWWARGTGDMDLDVRVDIADDLERVQLSGDDLKTALLLVQSSAISTDTFFNLLQRAGWSRPGSTPEDEAARIAAGVRMGDLDDEDEGDEGDEDEGDDDGDA